MIAIAFFLVLAQTATSLPEVPKTGNPTIDNTLVPILIGLFGAGGILAGVAKWVEATGLGQRVAELLRTTRGMVASIAEIGKEDVVAVLLTECPGMTIGEATAIASKIQDRLEKRIKNRAYAMGTEVILKPIVKETKAAIEAYKASSTDVKVPIEEVLK